jgi:archaemetzincin
MSSGSRIPDSMGGPWRLAGAVDAASPSSTLADVIGRVIAAALGVCALVAVTRPARADVEHRLCLLPLGQHDESLIPIVIRGVAHVYGLDVELLAPRDLPGSAWNASRGRHRAEKILTFLDNEVVPSTDCTAVVGFTSQDISTTLGRHRDWGMMGLAWVGGQSAVVSTHRLGRRASRRLRAKRAVKLVNHELGHALGLRHHDHCVMEDLRGRVATVDRGSGLLCEESRALLQQRGLVLPDRQEILWSDVLQATDR